MTDNASIKAARVRLSKAGVSIDMLGGNAPVQGEGFIGSHLRWYFRSRGERWKFHVYETGSRLFDDDLFVHAEAYGEWPEAGFISELQALQFIEKAVAFLGADIRSWKRKRHRT